MHGNHRTHPPSLGFGFARGRNRPLRCFARGRNRPLRPLAPRPGGRARPRGSKRPPILLVAALCALGACKVGPDFTTPAAKLNKDWKTALSPQIATQAATDQQWWKTFNDEALDRLVELAHQQNLSLQIAGLRIVEGRARLGIARGKLYPQTQEVFGGVSAVGVTAPISDGLGFNRNFATYQLGFDAAWEADLWGKFRRGVESETAGLLATVAQYYSAIVSLTAETVRNLVCRLN